MPEFDDSLIYSISSDGSLRIETGRVGERQRKRLRKCGLSHVGDGVWTASAPDLAALETAFAALTAEYWTIRVSPDSAGTVPGYEKQCVCGRPLPVSDTVRGELTSVVDRLKALRDRIDVTLASAEAMRTGETISSDDLLDLVGTLRDAASTHIDNAAEHVDAALLALLGDEREELVLGSYSCLDSPLGVCVYDDDEDPAHDDCLFCRHPEERK